MEFKASIEQWRDRLPVIVALVVLSAATFVLHRELAVVSLNDIRVEMGTLSSFQIGMALMVNYDRLAVAYLDPQLPW